MYFWVPIIACTHLTLLYINYTTNIFVPVVRKRILDIMLLLRTSSLREFFKSIILSIFQSYILASRVNFSRVSCIFFEPTSSLHEFILVQSLVYFFSLHPRFVSLFQSSLLYIFQSYILALLVYFNRVSFLFFMPASPLREFILVESLVYFSILHPRVASLL